MQMAANSMQMAIFSPLNHSSTPIPSWTPVLNRFFSSVPCFRCFFDERWSKHRVNLSLDWSPQFPELLLASYGSNDEAPLEPDGVVLVWNSKFKTETPEFVFHCQSAVTSGQKKNRFINIDTFLVRKIEAKRDCT